MWHEPEQRVRVVSCVVPCLIQQNHDQFSVRHTDTYLTYALLAHAMLRFQISMAFIVVPSNECVRSWLSDFYSLWHWCAHSTSWMNERILANHTTLQFNSIITVPWASSFEATMFSFCFYFSSPFVAVLFMGREKWREDLVRTNFDTKHTGKMYIFILCKFLLWCDGETVSPGRENQYEIIFGGEKYSRYSSSLTLLTWLVKNDLFSYRYYIASSGSRFVLLFNHILWAETREMVPKRIKAQRNCSIRFYIRIYPTGKET